jgi:hypothetical protein
MDKIIRLDYDGKVSEEEIREWIGFASKIIGVKVKKIATFKSRNGGMHVYVFTDDATDIQAFLFRYYAGEDRRRINADVRRWKSGYPIDYSYLFYAYIRKPQTRHELAAEFEYFIHVLAVANEYYPLY